MQSAHRILSVFPVDYSSLVYTVVVNNYRTILLYIVFDIVLILLISQ